MIEKEKFVEHNANAVAAGRVAGIDPVEEVKKRCVRIVGVLEPEVGGCILCRFSLHLFFFLALCNVQGLPWHLHQSPYGTSPGEILAIQ